MKQRLKDFIKMADNPSYLNNVKRINAYNIIMTRSLLFIMIIIFWMLVVLSLINSAFSIFSYVYIISLIFALIAFTFFSTSFIEKYSKQAIYLFFSIAFMALIYWSIAIAPQYRAFALLGLFCIVPFAFIDRSLRVDTFVGFFFVLHSVLSYLTKRVDIWYDDIITSFSFVIISIFLGNTLNRLVLQSFENERLLTIQKNVDFLTGLYNRRKLFEVLDENIDKQHSISGAIMFDIDHFKKLNDLHGHEYGDECLRIIGKTLKELEEKFHCAFFRYGGEEFLAIIDNGYDKESLLNMAKIIKLAIDATKIAFQDEQKQFLTISIGVAICERKDSGGNIAMIDCADKALYLAKETGRDKIVFYDDEVEEKLVLLGKEFISSVRHRDTVSKNKKSV